jgi:NADH:ubiquinone oxidoreductase subunit 5 (subunit L)/multisubunit Na+/H+ antiporter MnhA subunit
VYAALGHDRIDDLAGAARALPVAVAAFLIGGLALMGVLPSGAYLAKKLLLASADESGQWWWAWVLQGGAAFTAGYVVLIALRCFARPAAPLAGLQPVSRLSQWAALGLAVASLLLSLAAAVGPLPAQLLAKAFSLEELGSMLLVFAAGALLAAALARRPLLGGGAVRPGVAGLGMLFEAGDRLVRQWASSMLALLLVAGACGWLLARG